MPCWYCWRGVEGAPPREAAALRVFDNRLSRSGYGLDDPLLRRIDPHDPGPALLGDVLDQILSACGWLPLTGKFGFTTFTPLYTRWRPPGELRSLCTTRTPRLVEQTWGAEPFCSRTHYVCRDVTLSTAWKAYPGRMDIALSADLPGARDERLPRLSFIPDGRGVKPCPQCRG